MLINNDALSIQLPRSGLWDLRILDEDGDECIVNEIAVYEDEYVELTSEMLLACYQ